MNLSGPPSQPELSSPIKQNERSPEQRLSLLCVFSEACVGGISVFAAMKCYVGSLATPGSPAWTLSASIQCLEFCVGMLWSLNPWAAGLHLTVNLSLGAQM